MPDPVADPTYRMALSAARAAEEKKGGDIVLLEVSQVSTLADYFLLVSGYSLTQVRAIARAIEEQVWENWQQTPRRIEGQESGSWVLIDYADLIVHVLMQEERDYYDLESFWAQAHRVNLPIAG
ncbi:ribosome silencing factor [Thermostichus vulcanus]|uniref:Ribosomal silencing factor RsfS n=1 Tax=Thermostichus vulcanus str. 'Rupite' TaxID=2813851 RepID=A0ABT0C6R2_THEVL|nr:ribosome silencing factor [Thermostichus vulcanus]MCJ2541392.1 ribosome silencing factor [Thermostichus vulcanus str. 'Rupite']